MGDWKGAKPYDGEEGVIGAGAAPLFEPGTSWLSAKRSNQAELPDLNNF